MQYSPKLKKAMEEIKLIVKKYDIAAHVIIHTPGHSEYLNEITPSYAAVTMVQGVPRFRARLKEDFDGDKAAWLNKTTDTVNMFQHFTDLLAPAAITYMDFFEQLQKVVEIESTKGGHTSETTQNN